MAVRQERRILHVWAGYDGWSGDLERSVKGIPVYERILIPVDGSEISDRAAREGIRLAGLLGSSITLVYVVDLSILTIPDAETGIVNAEAIRGSFKAQGEAVLARHRDSAVASGVKAVAVLTEGDVHEEILRAAQDNGADLIVMGTHGRRGINRLILGSVAESVARRAHCAVLLVRPETVQ